MKSFFLLVAGFMVLAALLFFAWRMSVSPVPSKVANPPPRSADAAPVASAPAVSSSVMQAVSNNEAFPGTSAASSAATTAFESAAIDEQEHNHVIRTYTARLSPSLREVARLYRRDGTARFTMPLFDGREVTVVVDGLMDDGPDGGAVSGEVEGSEGSLVSLGFVDDAEAGTVQMPMTGEVYEIRPALNGGIVVNQIDATMLGTCGTCSPLVGQ